MRAAYLTPGPHVAKGFPLVSGAATQTLAPGDRDFPRRLTDVVGAPGWLDVRGTLVDRALSVAIVGARAASQRALERAHALAQAVVARDGVVVSGGALGVDGAAHRGALAAGGITWVVLGSGLDVPYPPRHLPLFDEIVARGGAVISTLARDAQPLPGYFVRRNAVIAALADLTIVVEASARSGALHTATAAARCGRRVVACPGSPGTEALLADGAGALRTDADLDLALDGGLPRRALVRPDDGSDAARVLDALDERQARDLEELAARTGLPLRAVGRAVTDLELAGLVRLAAGQLYVRSLLQATP